MKMLQKIPCRSRRGNVSSGWSVLKTIRADRTPEAGMEKEKIMLQADGNNRCINHLCIIGHVQFHKLFMMVPVNDPPVILTILPV